MVFSKRESALEGSPASRIFLPSSVSRKDAARCGEVPGVILASRELSSASGGGITGADSLTLGWRVDSVVVLDVGGVVGTFVRTSCSRILLSCGNAGRGDSFTGGATGAGGILAVETGGAGGR